MNNDHELIQAVIETLRQGVTLLTEISDESYTTKMAFPFNASIGGHYRPGLDHFNILLEAAPAGDLNYDCRARGTLVETNRNTALDATVELIARYESMDKDLLARPLNITCKTSYSTTHSQVSPSSVGREVMYAVAHAVHHYAIIRLMAGMMEVKLPADFGVAPSTLKYQAETAHAA